jgi:hypothetical protein
MKEHFRRLSWSAIGILFFGAVVHCKAQMAINDVASAKDFSIFCDQAGTYSVYKLNTSTDAVSIFRKIKLNDKLQVVSSNELEIEGNATFISYLTVDSIHLHIFRVEAAQNKSLFFLVTNDSDKIIASYRKPSSILDYSFDGRSGRFEKLRLGLIAQSKEEIIIYPYFEGGKSGKILSIEPLTGKTIWVLKERLKAIQIAIEDDRLVVLSEKSEFLDPNPDYDLKFFDIKDGSLVGEPYFGDPSLKRTIGIFKLIGKNIFVLGDELAPQRHINNLYVSVYDLNGNLISEKIEEKPYKLDLLFKGIGTVNDDDGNLLVFGESYRRLYVKGPVRTVYASASVLNVFSSIWQPSVVFIPKLQGNGRWEDVVENFKVYKIKAQDLAIEDSYTFQTERRSGFTRFYSFDNNVFVRLGERIWYYNVSESSVPPRLMTSLDEKKEIMITAFGPISLENKAGSVVIEKLLND